MTDKKSIESRRKLLKSIAAGSGAIVAGKSLPDSWGRPVVDSVMLPAHAQTSAQIYSGNNLTTGTVGKIKNQSDSMMAGLLNSVISPANAQEEIVILGCAMVMGGNVEFWVQVYGDGVFDIVGSTPLIGTGQVTWSFPCGGLPQMAPASVIAYLPDTYIDIDIAEGFVRFPIADACVAKVNLAPFCT